MEHLEYMIDGEFQQFIAQKINMDLAFPEKIKIMKAELYTFNPQPRASTWKDGTGKVQRTWTFPMWVKVWDQDGVCGEGSASPDIWNNYLPFMMGIDEPLDNIQWRRMLYWKDRGGMTRAMGQMELILFDIIAKRRGVPMHRLLGATKDWCDCYKGGGSVLRTDEELVDEILSFKEQGFKATKFKMSIREPERDVRRLKMVREAVGPDFKIAIDSNQAWDAETCMKYLREAYQYNIEFWEEPIVHTQGDEIAKFVDMMKKENIYIPLAYGENSQGFQAFYDFYMNAGVEIVQPNGMNYTIAEGLKMAKYIKSKGHRITTGQNHGGCLFGTFLEKGEMVEFHRPNVEGIENYYIECPKIGPDGYMHMPEIAGYPITVDFDKLKADGCLNSIQYKKR